MKITLYILGVVSLATFVYCVIYCAISFNIIKLFDLIQAGFVEKV